MSKVGFKWLVSAIFLGLVGCSSAPEYDRETAGGRYTVRQDFAPDNPPDVSRVPDAVPEDIAYSRGGNRSTYEVWGKQYSVLPSHIGYKAEGTASWYGLKFHGHKTSNGEIYDIYKMSAAHKSLPIPSFARVTNLDNGQSVVVRVNDRGPFHDDRLIDLSYSAAARLDILKRGTGRVRVEAIDARNMSAANTPSIDTVPVQNVGEKPAPRSATPQGRYLQIGAFGNENSARLVQARLSEVNGLSAKVVAIKRGDTTLHRVVVGPLADSLSPEPLIQKIEALGYSSPLLINSL